MTRMHEGHTLTAVLDPVGDVLDAPDGRLVVTAPPQEGLKTAVARSATILAVARGQRVIHAAYREQVARNTVGPGDRLVTPVGVGGALHGRVADLLIVDEPLASLDPTQQEIQRAWDWLHHVALCRLTPGGSVVVFATRTGPADVPGCLIEAGWTHVNIPVLAEDGVPDALGREPGTWLPSLRGHTPEQWQALRLKVGERRWRTMYQGVPREQEVLV